MEKINDFKVMNLNMKKISLSTTIYTNLTLKLWLVLMLLVPSISNSQIRSGFGYLKMVPGAREASTWGTSTGALDHTHSFYVNPGATGLVREWQCSATYTKWMSDLYNTSFLYGRKIRMPWSSQTRFMFGVNYLGIPEFNNLNQSSAAVSGSNLLATVGIGQPFRLASNTISLGANVKYFKNKLAGNSINSLIFDLGIIGRTKRFHFMSSILDYMIISAGVSATNLVGPIRISSVVTPYPRTLHTGIALNLGTHAGIQLNLAADYRKVRDENGFLSVGSEISWRQMFGVRMGYSFEDNLLGHFTFGASLRLDSQTIRTKLFGKNNAVRLDMATNQTNEYLNSPYHGTVTYQPLAPENFRLVSPAYNETINEERVTLNWDTTRDPDLYDDVMYLLVVDPDSFKLAELLTQIKRNSDDIFLSLESNSFLEVQSLPRNHFQMDGLSGGDYFWMVMAYDIDRHVRLGEMDSQTIAKFHVSAPAPKILAMKFDYSRWITQDDYQGIIRLVVSNTGDRVANNFALTVYDSIPSPDSSPGQIGALISQKKVPTLQPGETTTVSLDWRTQAAGLHSMHAEISWPDKKELIVNRHSEAFYTIPKGTFNTADTVVVQKQSRKIYDIPYVGKVFFDSNSVDIDENFTHDWHIEPPLAVFARRLKANPSVNVSLQGTIDANSNEQNIALANERASAVRIAMHKLGVPLKQMEVIPGVALPTRRLPRNKEDIRWILQERRRVEITIDPVSEKLIFQPVQLTHTQRDNIPIKFNTDIRSVIPYQQGALELMNGAITESSSISNSLRGTRLKESIDWHPDQADQKHIDDWLEKDVEYSLSLTDTLDRSFQVRPKKTHLNLDLADLERKYYVPAKFGETEALYRFYWEKMVEVIPFLLEEPDTRMRFVGHGCATGPDQINNVLSKNRAKNFQKKFLKDVKSLYPDLYEDIKERIDNSEGFGESVPLEFKSKSGETQLLGDNKTPLGRVLNRRMMIHFYNNY